MTPVTTSTGVPNTGMYTVSTPGPAMLTTWRRRKRHFVLVGWGWRSSSAVGKVKSVSCSLADDGNCLSGDPRWRGGRPFAYSHLSDLRLRANVRANGRPERVSHAPYLWISRCGLLKTGPELWMRLLVSCGSQTDLGRADWWHDCLNGAHPAMTSAYDVLDRELADARDPQGPYPQSTACA